MGEAIVNDESSLESRKHVAAVTPIKVDNPHGEWLREHREDAITRYTESQHPGVHKIAGGKTAQCDLAYIDTGYATQIPGLHEEQRVMSEGAWSKEHQAYLDHMASDMKKNGYDPRHPVSIAVSYNGKPWVYEGNHRIEAARRAGIEHIPAEIGWFAGGEEADGPFSFDKFRHAEVYDTRTKKTVKKW